MTNESRRKANGERKQWTRTANKNGEQEWRKRLTRLWQMKLNLARNKVVKRFYWSACCPVLFSEDTLPNLACLHWYLANFWNPKCTTTSPIHSMYYIGYKVRSLQIVGCESELVMWYAQERCAWWPVLISYSLAGTYIWMLQAACIKLKATMLTEYSSDSWIWAKRLNGERLCISNRL